MSSNAGASDILAVKPDSPLKKAKAPPVKKSTGNFKAVRKVYVNINDKYLFLVHTNADGTLSQTVSDAVNSFKQLYPPTDLPNPETVALQTDQRNRAGEVIPGKKVDLPLLLNAGKALDDYDTLYFIPLRAGFPSQSDNAANQGKKRKNTELAAPKESGQGSPKKRAKAGPKEATAPTSTPAAINKKNNKAKAAPKPTNNGDGNIKTGSGSKAPASQKKVPGPGSKQGAKHSAKQQVSKPAATQGKADNLSEDSPVADKKASKSPAKKAETRQQTKSTQAAGTPNKSAKGKKKGQEAPLSEKKIVPGSSIAVDAELEQEPQKSEQAEEQPQPTPGGKKRRRSRGGKNSDKKKTT